MAKIAGLLEAVEESHSKASSSPTSGLTVSDFGVLVADVVGALLPFTRELCGLAGTIRDRTCMVYSADPKARVFETVPRSRPRPSQCSKPIKAPEKPGKSP